MYKGQINLSAIRRGANDCIAVYRGSGLVWSANSFDFQALIDAFKARVASDNAVFESEADMMATLIGMVGEDLNGETLSNAKLLMIPHAFKAGKLYSAIGPDFAVSRASGRSRCAAGNVLEYLADHVPAVDYTLGPPLVLVEPQRTNLYADPLDFGSVNWQRLRVTATPDASVFAPGATTTAHRFAETNEGNSKLLIQSRNFTSGLPYSVSGFAKKGAGALAPSWVQMLLASATFGSVQYGAFNLDTLEFEAYGGATARVQNFAENWVRTSLTATALSSGTGNQTFYAFCNNASTPRLPLYTGSTDSDMFAWGSQLEQAATPSSFIPPSNPGGIREADLISVSVPPGTAKIIQKVNDEVTEITSGIPATYTLPQGFVHYIVML